MESGSFGLTLHFLTVDSGFESAVIFPYVMTALIDAHDHEGARHSTGR